MTRVRVRDASPNRHATPSPVRLFSCQRLLHPSLLSLPSLYCDLDERLASEWQIQANEEIIRPSCVTAAHAATHALRMQLESKIR